MSFTPPAGEMSINLAKTITVTKTSTCHELKLMSTLLKPGITARN